MKYSEAKVSKNTSDIKLCKNCIYFNCSYMDIARCKRTGEESIGLVNGHVIKPNLESCNRERYADAVNSCGPDGKFYVCKERFIEKIKRKWKNDILGGWFNFHC
jgi:hypothetical protein